MIVTLVVLMLIDVCFGVLNAFSARTVNSTVSARGMTKKVGTLLLVIVGLIVEPYAHGVPTGTVVALFYVTTEAISVLENAGKLGVPLPGSLLDALQKIRGESAPPITLAVEIPHDRAIVTRQLHGGADAISITTQDVAKEDQKHRRLGDQEAS